MICQRCSTKMYEASIYDPSKWVISWCCPICGECWDKTIDKNRHHHVPRAKGDNRGPHQNRRDSTVEWRVR